MDRRQEDANNDALGELRAMGVRFPYWGSTYSAPMTEFQFYRVQDMLGLAEGRWVPGYVHRLAFAGIGNSSITQLSKEVDTGVMLLALGNPELSLN
jgi:hypothetical protein